MPLFMVVLAPVGLYSSKACITFFIGFTVAVPVLLAAVGVLNGVGYCVSIMTS